MNQVDYTQLQEHLIELLEQVSRGEEVVILRNDQPVAKLTSVEPAPKKERVFGSAKGLIELAEDFDEPLDDFKEYM